jgi:hypothetical protein
MSSYGTAYATAKSSMIGTSRGLAIKKSRKKYEEEKMKRTLKQRFKDWLFDENQLHQIDGISVDEDSIQLSRDKSIRFEIHTASGGRVVQTRRYDSQKDRHIENLYVITSDMDFGREIDKIITMEALR